VYTVNQMEFGSLSTVDLCHGTRIRRTSVTTQNNPSSTTSICCGLAGQQADVQQVEHRLRFRVTRSTQPSIPPG